ncbi:uncharacterized protein LOC113494286 [Trichoplusia ni]|uniref:Uncharacterized protein LOC113494286 n=1 Tax=Trichoplusia ni TaxID=7111 RepID=A0A7E5VJA6_TRINI|nr:uncharacterized protein LOC113494286 [Trichoplusia ni]
MPKKKPFCVFCGSKRKVLISFSENDIRKCSSILEIRQSNNLPSKNVKVPLELNDIEQYHSKCYKKFCTLPPEYRKPSAASGSRGEAQTSDEDEDGNLQWAKKRIDFASSEESLVPSVGSVTDRSESDDEDD